MHNADMTYLAQYSQGHSTTRTLLLCCESVILKLLTELFRDSSLMIIFHKFWQAAY